MLPTFKRVGNIKFGGTKSNCDEMALTSFILTDNDRLRLFKEVLSKMAFHLQLIRENYE